MIDLHDLLTATNGRVLGDPAACRFSGFAFDSRITKPGELFVALVTETGDGHDYVDAACRQGATGVVCQHPPLAPLSGITHIVVENSQQALSDYARYILRRRQIEVVGITGSVGKTSTKEAIAAVLQKRHQVFRNPGNYSGRLGLPISLGSLGDRERLVILEMACDSHGEIRHLAEIARPRIGIVTAIGPSHLEVFGTIDQVAREKRQLIQALPQSGVAILNYDDHRTRDMRADARARVVTFGLSPQADLFADEVCATAAGTWLTAHWQQCTSRLFLPLVGAHHAYTALAAAAVGLIYGLSWEDIAAGLGQVAPLPGRTRLLEGLNGAQLLDDSYDANPLSALSALAALEALPAQRRFVVLGDMTHLDRHTEEAHRIVGRRCAEIADRIYAKGELARIAVDEALQRGLPPDRTQISFTDGDIVAKLQRELRPGDLVLLKGSAEARLERITAALLADRSLAEALLPRQNRGWQQVRLQRLGRPTWVEIDLDAIARNVRHIVDQVAPAQVMAVLKADGYGHGAAKIARTALNNGATWLGVACLGEAIALRQGGIDAPILILGYTPAWQARGAVLHDVVATVFSADVARALARAAGDLGRTARVHVKVDTGMGRLGLLPDQVLSFMRAISDLPALQVDGLFTHFAAADDDDLSYTNWQLECFQEVLSALGEQGLLPAHVHAANSAAIMRLPASRFDLVRLGIAMYGLSPSPYTDCPPGFAPALTFKCQIAQVKELEKGSYISYGRTYCTPRRSRIAVIPVGYADGFRRAPAHWGEVLVRGERAPIVGRVCMDQTMIDVTDIPGVRQGDEVVLIGSQGDDEITVEQVAARLGTINYEVVSEILARVPRIV